MQIKALLVVFTLTVAIVGCDPDGEDLHQQNDRLQSRLSNAEQQIQTLQEQNDQLRKQLCNAQQELNDAKQVIDIQTGRVKTYRAWVVVFCSIGALFVGLILGVILKRGNEPASLKKLEGVLECPRCHWKHAPGETKCRKCGTRF